MNKLNGYLLVALQALPFHLAASTMPRLLGGNRWSPCWGSLSCWFADLGKHGFAVLGHHAALVTVEGHEVAVECLLGVLEHVVQLCGTPLKNASEVAWYQGPANGYRDGRNFFRTEISLTVEEKKDQDVPFTLPDSRTTKKA